MDDGSHPRRRSNQPGHARRSSPATSIFLPRTYSCSFLDSPCTSSPFFTNFKTDGHHLPIDASRHIYTRAQNLHRYTLQNLICFFALINMMGRSPRAAVMLALLLLLCFLSGATARTFTIINKCGTTIWPAVTPSPSDSFGGGGFELKSGQSVVYDAPPAWSGRIWGRTDCAFDGSGTGKCGTGSCGPNLKCSGASGDPPASLAEFTLATPDFYDVSLVDGFNLPITVQPVKGHGPGNCSAAGCDGDLRDTCPDELAVKGAGGKTVACRSACDVFNTDQYCCRGKFAGPSTCPPTPYSKKFKEACPTAYSYAYDDPSSLFQCSGADYVVTFCSNSKQSVCTYHNNKLVCNGSGRYLPPAMSAAMTILLLFGSVALQFSV